MYKMGWVIFESRFLLDRHGNHCGLASSSDSIRSAKFV
jgi:hypothetical protein